jgi:hypothetical protein
VQGLPRLSPKRALGAALRQLTRFRWTTFDLNDWLPAGWRRGVLAAAAIADIREFPRTPVLSRESQEVRHITRGRVPADLVGNLLPHSPEADNMGSQPSGDKS